MATEELIGDGMMTDTDNLRRMLDERGVEWGNVRNDGSESDYLTEWELDDIHGYAAATEWVFGSGLSMEIHRYQLTPEQAIAATVGTDTCRLKKGETTWFAGYNGYVTEWTCDECGGLTFYDAEMRPRFCANCGRKVVE